MYGSSNLIVILHYTIKITLTWTKYHHLYNSSKQIFGHRSEAILLLSFLFQSVFKDLSINFEIETIKTFFSLHVCILSLIRIQSLDRRTDWLCKILESCSTVMYLPDSYLRPSKSDIGSILKYVSHPVAINNILSCFIKVYAYSVELADLQTLESLFQFRDDVSSL